MHSSALPKWTPQLLIAAGVYYLLLAVSSSVWPMSWYWTSGIVPTDTEQAILMVHVAGTPLYVFAFGAFISLLHPTRFWVVSAMLWLHNVIDFCVNLNATLNSRLPPLNGVLFMAFGALFAGAFGRVVWSIYRESSSSADSRPVTLDDALSLIPDGSAQTLAELSDTRPLLLVLIRHTGCTFCREVLDRLASELKARTAPPPTIVIVGLGRLEAIREMVNSFGLSQVLILSDQEQKVYRALELPRGGVWRLFGPRELWRAIGRGSLAHYGIGRVEGDPFQLPGTALIRDRKVVSIHRAKSAADYCEFRPFMETT
jgi:AhpC/TSA antioxidant enzyme